MLVNESFENNTMQPNFTRDIFKTIAEMKAVPKKKMPKMLISACLETGKIYVYNKSGEVDETLGLWREIGFAKNEQGDSGTGEGSEGVSKDEVKSAIDEAIAKVTAHTMFQFDTLPEEDIDGIKFAVGMTAYQKSDKSIYEVEQYFDGKVAWKFVTGVTGGGGTNPSEPSEPSEPSTKYTLYYGYINGSLPTTEKVTDEGFTINADVLKALSSKTITSKSNSITYTATETEDNALGQSFPTYAYPASLGEITKYTNSVGTFNVADSYTRFDVDVDGTAYYAYVQTKGHAPMAGDTFDFTYA